MKRILLLLFLIIVLILLVNKKEIKENNISELRGIYISYIEISKYLNDKDEISSKKEIDKMIDNIKTINCNTIILQVRPSTDSIYNSKIFPVSKYLSSKESYPFDVLKYFIEKSHEQNLKVIAWINPYRISTTSNINEIKENSPAFKYIDSDVVYIGNGIFFNPAKEEVKQLIIDGVKEVLNYKVDKILFDDYFYPSNDIDILEYEKVKEKKTIEEFHLENVNDLIKRVHTECKKKNIPFGISPDGNIENNYNKNYADVKQWLSSSEYVDFIMPQLYYGFNNTTKPFIKTINEWNELIKNKDIDLYIALAFYKVGTLDTYARDGKDEWINNNNIIMKEIIYSRNITHYKGFSLYRYDNIFDESNFTNTSYSELKSVKRILK